MRYETKNTYIYIYSVLIKTITLFTCLLLLFTSCDNLFSDKFAQIFLDSVATKVTFYIEDPTDNPDALKIEKNIFVPKKEDTDTPSELTEFPLWSDPIFTEWNNAKGENKRIIGFSPINTEETTGGYYSNYVVEWGQKYVVKHILQKTDGSSDVTNVWKQEEDFGKIGHIIEFTDLTTEHFYLDTDSTYASTSFQIDAFSEDAKTVCVYWIRKKYTVTFSSGDGVFPDGVSYDASGNYIITGLYGSALGVPSSPTLEDNYFIGWQDSDTGNIIVTDDLPSEIFGNKTYTAIFGISPITITNPTISTTYVDKITDTDLYSAKIQTTTTVTIPILPEVISIIKEEDGIKYLSYQVGTYNASVQILNNGTDHSATINLSKLSGISLESGSLKLTLSAKPKDNELIDSVYNIYYINPQVITVILTKE